MCLLDIVNSYKIKKIYLKLCYNRFSQWGLMNKEKDISKEGNRIL